MASSHPGGCAGGSAGWVRAVVSDHWCWKPTFSLLCNLKLLFQNLSLTSLFSLFILTSMIFLKGFPEWIFALGYFFKWVCVSLLCHSLGALSSPSHITLFFPDQKAGPKFILHKALHWSHKFKASHGKSHVNWDLMFHLEMWSTVRHTLADMLGQFSLGPWKTQQTDTEWFPLRTFAQFSTPWEPHQLVDFLLQWPPIPSFLYQVSNWLPFCLH